MTDTAIAMQANGKRKSAMPRLTGWIVPVVSIAVFMLVWEAIIRIFDVPVYLLPPPSKVLHVAIGQSAFLFKHALSTSWAILLGFGFAFAIGIPVATLMVYSASFSRAIYPILITAQVLPKVALAPLFIVWFGFWPHA